MISSLYLSAAMLEPTAAVVFICIALVFAILIVIGIRSSFPTKALTPLKPFNPSDSPAQMRSATLEEQKKAAQTCFDLTVTLLKKAIIKKTYKEFRLMERYRTIYTIPLNAKEAAMYLWARVITIATKDERERVIRMAAHIFRMFEENKEKHVLELEAQAVAAVRIYGGVNAAEILQIRAVDNIEMVKKYTKPLCVTHLDFALLKASPDMLVAENVEFSWPKEVSSFAKKLKEAALFAVSQGDLLDFSTFPCCVCKQVCRLSELENLKCEKCRKGQ